MSSDCTLNEVGEQLVYQVVRPRTVSPERVWKCLGFASITTPGRIFDVDSFSVWVDMGHRNSYLVTEDPSRLVQVCLEQTVVVYGRWYS